MSIPETLLAAVCLLVTCSGIAAMAEDWRDTASANRAAAEFTVTAKRAASKRAFSWQKTAFLSGETKSSAQPLSVPDAALSPQPCPPVPGEPSSPFPKAAPSPPCRQTASFPVLPYPEEKKRAWTRRSA